MPADINLQWEWPAERTIQQKWLIQIEKITESRKGFFGINNSASMVNGFPNPVVLSGKIIDHANQITSVELILPKLELHGLVEKQYAVLGLIHDNICICIKPVDSPDIDLDEIDCP